jgi:outer membrane lipase/esterase
MHFNWKTPAAWGLLALTGTLMVACGGGDPVGPKVAINRVVVAGDSLADVGTFGLKFTVQKAGDAAGYPIWPQLVANSFGLSGADQCNFYGFTGTIFAPNPTAGCTNFAIGGAKIVYDDPNQAIAQINPLNIGVQLANRAAGGNYAATDLLLIDGGGNDLAALTGAYLAAQSNPNGYIAFLAQQLDTVTINGLLTSNPTTGGALAAGAYAVELADTFYDVITAQALDKGAMHVAILNAPDITLTPRFKAVLLGVTAQTDAATAAAIKVAIQGWTQAFNAQLAARAAGDSRVALVDFYADFADQGANPDDYSLTNIADASCPVTGTGTDGLPEYDFPTCSDVALDAITGKTAGWWQSYAFSDGFHPTPYGHQLLAASVNRALARAGWL